MRVFLERFLRARFSLRYKILALALVPLLLIVPAILGAAVIWGEALNTRFLSYKASTDLMVATDAFRNIQQGLLDQLRRISESIEFRVHLEKGDKVGLEQDAQHWLKETRFAFIDILDRDGAPLCQSPGAAGRPSPTPQLGRAIAGVPAIGIQVFARENLQDQGRPEQVWLPRTKAPRHGPGTLAVPDRAMLLRATFPVRDRSGHVTAILDGGVPLHHDSVFVDRIRDLVYGPGSLPEGGIGAITLVVGDVRIATNLELAPGVRAVDSRIPRTVRGAVLDRGESWSGRTREAGEWYISAYAPLVDLFGARVGMLHTGFLEAPFRADFYQALVAAISMLGIALGLVVWAVIRGAGTIFKPIETMTGVVRAIQAGRHARMGAVTARDEIGALARQFDAMLDLLVERNREIRKAAASLEVKVEERTRELRRKNEDLQQTIDALNQTRQRLVTAEKLAALGRLSAGIAHEINNPIAVIQGNMEVLTQEFGERLAPVRGEVDLVFEQVDRIRSLVASLLQYARPGQHNGVAEPVRPVEMLRQCRDLVQHLARNSAVEVTFGPQTDRSILASAAELQQVLVNLCINGIQAMPDGGRLELSSGEWGKEGVTIEVADQGPGIAPEYLDRVFDPFFSTKKDGTGLGLSISYGLIRRHGGGIAVQSAPGEGSRFRVYLPGRPLTRSEPLLEPEVYVQAVSSDQINRPWSEKS